MNPYLKIIQENELYARDLCKNLSVQIIEEINRSVLIKPILVSNNLTPYKFIGLVFMDPAFRGFRPLLTSILTKYSANYYSLLWNYVKVLACANPILTSVVIRELEGSLVWSNIDNTNAFFTISTLRGNFQFLRLEDFLPVNFRPLNNVNAYFGHCHDAVWTLARYFKEYDAKTVKMPNLLGGGSFYHSYFEKDGTVLDFSSNVAVVLDSLSRIIRPEEIFCCPAVELVDRYETLCYEDPEVPSNICPVLTLAINNERKLK